MISCIILLWWINPLHRQEVTKQAEEVPLNPVTSTHQIPFIESGEHVYEVIKVNTNLLQFQNWTVHQVKKGWLKTY